MSEIRPAKQPNFISWIFISSEEPRLRAGWRLLVQTLLMIVIGFGPLLTLLTLTSFGKNGQIDYLVADILGLIISTSSIYIARRLLDKRSFTSLGLLLNERTFIDILRGIAITFLIMGFIYLYELAAGWLSFKSFAWQTESPARVVGGVLLFFVMFILGSWNQELLSRGYHLQTIASGMNTFWGMVISCGVFGLLHMGVPNATWGGAAGNFFVGLFLSYAYLRTGQLWLSIGLHTGWNFFEGVVFGFPVSGFKIYPLARIQVHGPEIWTGGMFGPEAGLIVLPALAIGFVLIYLYTSKK